MNTNTLAHTEPRQMWRQMADEHAAMELLEALDRIASLEADVRSYREVSQATIHALSALTAERDQLRQTVRDLRDLLREYEAHANRAAA